MYSCKYGTPFVALLWLLCFHVGSGTPIIVSLPGKSVQLRGEVADFGYQFDQLSTHPANLMLAPEEDPYLCSYPTSLENAPPRDATSPIALFVSRGECSFEEKALIALAIQRNFTQDLQYVIVYNNDRDNPSQLIRMGAVNVDLPTLGFVAVSTRAGSYTMSNILYAAETAQQSPYLGTNETDWLYPIDIEQFTASFSRGSAGANTFYLLRFVLFTLLIIAPCLRAGWLWYNGGGRITFQRNERGRIVGLRYIRPMPLWFAPSAQTTSHPPRIQLLTEDQVLALPEITFEKDDDGDSTDNPSVEYDTASLTEEPPQECAEPLEPDIVVSPAMNDEENGQQITQAPITNDGESPETPPAQELPEGLTTTCTMCSICIDEFENGERIRVLPKCKHGFHTDCLMPWLTERQGCCPLCKRSVLGPDDEDSDHGENRDIETGVELVNQAQHVSAQERIDNGDGGNESGEEWIRSDQAVINAEEPEIQVEASATTSSNEDEANGDPVTTVAVEENEPPNQGSENQGQATRTDIRIGDSPV